MKKYRLKPCPFCKSDDVHIVTGKDILWVKEEYQGNFRAVSCHNCYCIGSLFNVLALGEEEAEKRAVENWNCRSEKTYNNILYKRF